MSDKPKNKGGRPPKHPGDTRTSTLSYRMRGSTAEMLKAAATASGRSVAEEIEYRVRLSFDREALLAQVKEAVQPQLYYGPNPIFPEIPHLPS